MANFPGSLDSLTNPTAGNTLDSPSHSGQHATANDILEAVEAKVGTGSSTPTSGTVLTGTGVGTSAWQTPTSAQVFLQDDDPGAVGTGSLWVQTDPDGNFSSLQMWVRNAADDGWQQAGAGSFYDDGVLTQQVGMWDAPTGRMVAGMLVDSNAVTLQSWVPANDGSARKQIGVGQGAIFMVGLPTADPAVDGFLWNDAGTVKISPSAGSVSAQGIYTGAGVSIANVASASLPWTTLQDGTELLDRSTPTAPTVLADGVYALTIFIETSALTAGGFYNANLAIERGIAGVFQTLMVATEPSTETVLSATLLLEAGDELNVVIDSQDGASSRTFGITNAAIVKIT